MAITVKENYIHTFYTLRVLPRISIVVAKRERPPPGIYLWNFKKAGLWVRAEAQLHSNRSSASGSQAEAMAQGICLSSGRAYGGYYQDRTTQTV